MKSSRVILGSAVSVVVLFLMLIILHCVVAVLENFQQWFSTDRDFILGGIDLIPYAAYFIANMG